MPDKKNNQKDLPAKAGKKIVIKGAREVHVSTVCTSIEVYDYLRLFARVGN